MVNFINMDTKHSNLFKSTDCNIIVCLRIKIKV